MTIEVVGDDPIEFQLTEEQLNLTKRKHAWRLSKPVLAPIVNALNLIGIEPTMSGNELNVSFTGDKVLLLKALRIITAAGFRSTDEKPKKGDTGWHAWFRSDASKLSIWFYFTSSVCRQVQVGTRTTEIPVYETRCGDDLGQVDFTDGAGNTPVELEATERLSQDI